MKYLVSVYLKSGGVIETFTFNEREADNIHSGFKNYLKDNSKRLGSYELGQKAPNHHGSNDEIFTIDFGQVESVRTTEAES